jgi:hypothetical protein
MSDAVQEIAPWRPFEVMERVEDEAVLQELRGEVVESLVYEFVDHEGRRVIGLSKAGVDRVASEMALKGEVLRELDFELFTDPDSVTAVIKAGRFAVSQDGREVLLETVFGSKRQPRRREVYVKGKDGKPVIRDGQPVKRLEEDPFVVEIAMAKAARNAKRRLMPESLIAKVVDMARSEGRVRKLASPGETGAPKGVQNAASPKTRTPVAASDISSEEFIQQAKAKGYGSWREILEALKLKSTKEVRDMGFGKALELLTSRVAPEPQKEGTDPAAKEAQGTEEPTLDF